MIKLKCEKCSIEYEKPAIFKTWNNKHPNIFYKWSLIFCDTCRREKENKALKNLPKIIEALANNQK